MLTALNPHWSHAFRSDYDGESTYRCRIGSGPEFQVSVRYGLCLGNHKHHSPIEASEPYKLIGTVYLSYNVSVFPCERTVAELTKVHGWGHLVAARYNRDTKQIEYLGDPPAAPVGWPAHNPTMLITPAWAERLRQLDNAKRTPINPHHSNGWPLWVAHLQPVAGGSPTTWDFFAGSLGDAEAYVTRVAPEEGYEVLNVELAPEPCPDPAVRGEWLQKAN